MEIFISVSQFQPFFISGYKQNGSFDHSTNQVPSAAANTIRASAYWVGGEMVDDPDLRLQRYSCSLYFREYVRIHYGKRRRFSCQLFLLLPFTPQFQMAFSNLQFGAPVVGPQLFANRCLTKYKCFEYMC